MTHHLRGTSSNLIRLYCAVALFPGAFAAGTATTSAAERALPSLAAREQFLETAQIVSEQPIAKGLTKTRKAILSDGHITHAAHIQPIDVYMADFHGTDGSEERDFKDSWKFNVAAYRLAKLLDLTDMVPVSVERVVDDKPSAVTWWVDDILMDEKQRIEGNIRPPDIDHWTDQVNTVRTFDQLIYNMDRNRENILISTDWNIWMIDESRAFRKWPSLKNPSDITVCNPDLQRALGALNLAAVTRELSPYLTAEEIAGLMARRDLIVGLLKDHASAPRAKAKLGRGN